MTTLVTIVIAVVLMATGLIFTSFRFVDRLCQWIEAKIGIETTLGWVLILILLRVIPITLLLVGAGLIIFAPPPN